jgi:hypothetical protein
VRVAADRAGRATLPNVVAHRQEQSQGGHDAEHDEGLHFRTSFPNGDPISTVRRMRTAPTLIPSHVRRRVEPVAPDGSLAIRRPRL